ncbi:aspartate aminotransferase family protein [Maribellus sediminis]|uniref:aspartate aminotransferase family protein n=1 Tax=Maribellus sediminis TaxID=2696285 RepID=UPI001431375B|nr:aminotransferase class III-fold pyridoxal phosphate-dependent enzyme [Maribellus sediminis]
MGNNFAISEYHDVQEIYTRVEKLLTLPVYRVKRDKMQEYLDRFDSNCAKSKAMIDEAKKYIPGGVQHNLAFNYPFPLVFTKAEDAWLYDLDGNRYIDFLQAGGPTVLGSNPPAIKEKVKNLLDTCGPVTGLFHEYEMKIAEFICKRYPGVDKFRMLGSGTEGVMAAIRVARLSTGKKKIIKLGGAYHGWSDQMVYGMRIPGTGRFEAHGIPAACSKHTQEAFPNKIKAIEKLLKRNRLVGGTAAVIVEPVGPESGTRPIDQDYNKKIRELCDKYGALLIFDEVVTAFRIGLNGAQGYFGVVPDLTVFGKVVAGGYPSAGGLGGLDKHMDYLTAGLGGTKKKAMVGGTLAANPLSSAAGYYTLVEIEKQNACAVAGKAGDRLTKGLQALIEKYELPYVAYNQGSICHLETAGTMFVDVNIKRPWTIPKSLKQIKVRKKNMEEMGAAYMAEGLVTLAGSRMYTSMADTDEIIDEALQRFERVFQHIERSE